MEEQRIKWQKTDRIWLGVTAALGVLLFVRCFFAYACNDEAFYVSTVMRFVRGERMMVDEWFPTQLFSFFLLPLGWLYRSLTGGTEGILLAARILYITVQLLGTVWIYRRFVRADQRSAGLLISFLFLLQTPYGINALCYNTLQLMAMLLYVVILATEKEYGLPVCLGVGLCWGVMVLCNPYTLLVPVLTALAVLIKKGRGEGILSWKKYGLCLGGSVLLAVIFLGYLFIRITPAQLLENLPYVLGSDAYEKKSQLHQAGSYVYRFCLRYLWLLLLLFAQAVWQLLDKKRQEHRGRYLYLSFGTVLAWDVYALLAQSRYAINYIQVPLALAGILWWLLLQDKEKKKGLAALYALTVAFTFGIHFASNVGVPTFSAGYAAAEIPAFLCLCALLAEMGAAGRAMRKGVLLLAAACGVLLLYSRLTTAFMEATPITGCRVPVERGPYKGLTVSEKYAGKYERVLSLVDLHKPQATDRVLFVDVQDGPGESYKFGGGPVLYLYADTRIGSPSNLFSHVTGDSFEEYFALHPENFPTVVYCLAEEAGDGSLPILEKCRQSGYTELTTAEGDRVLFAP